MNESILPGEPVIGKSVCEADFDPEATYPSNVVMRGSTVVDGHGVMEVEQVGDATGYGKVYEGSQIEEGYKSVAFSLVFRSPERSLETAEVNKIVDKILAELEKMGVKIRA